MRANLCCLASVAREEICEPVDIFDVVDATEMGLRIFEGIVADGRCTYAGFGSKFLGVDATYGRAYAPAGLRVDRWRMESLERFCPSCWSHVADLKALSVKLEELVVRA